MTDDSLPPLPFEEWEPTKDTLHLWAQIIGKTRQALMPMRNHWWNVTLSPSARGLTTRRMPVEARNLEIEIDLVGHRLAARTTESEAGFALHDGLSVADFRQHLDGALKALDVNVAIRDEPCGVPTTTPFSTDRAPRELRRRRRRAISAGPPVEHRRARGVRRLVLRQDQPRAPLLAQLRPGHGQVLRQAGGDCARR